MKINTIDAIKHEIEPNMARGLPLGAPRFKQKLQQPTIGIHENARPTQAHVVATASPASDVCVAACSGAKAGTTYTVYMLRSRLDAAPGCVV